MTIETVVSSNQIPEPEIPQRKSVINKTGWLTLRAAFIGFFVDMFDVYLPIVALGPAMSYFQPATLSPALKSTLFYVVFALSLVGRPVGAILFGHYGDKLGRRRVTIISMGGFALVTLLIGLLPGYEIWGVGSIAALTFLRFVDGVFLGGEYTGANPLAMEYAPKEKRGAWAAFIHTGFPLSLAAISLITTGLSRLLPAGSPHSLYVQWGWRIPFFLGALFSGGVFLYCIRNVRESTVWAKAEKMKSPLKDLFSGDNFRRLSQVLLVMSGAWFTLNAVTSILPGVLLTVRHVNSITVTNAQLVANLLLAVSFVPFGILGQKIGRRAMLALIGLAGMHGRSDFLLFIVEVRVPKSGAIDGAANAHQATPVWAVVTAYITERFPTAVRASGNGIGYSAATIIPAFSSFYMLGLKGLGMHYAYTEIVVFALGGLLLVVGARLGPETVHVDIT